MPIYANPDSNIGERLDEFTVPFMRAFTTAVDETVTRGAGIFTGGLRDLVRRDLLNPPGVRGTGIVPREEANKRAAAVGLPAFDSDIPDDNLEFLIYDQLESQLRQRILASGADRRSGLQKGALWGAEFIASMFDPIAFGASVIPLAGPASKALSLGRTIERMSPFTRALGRGAFEGAAGNLLIEPANFYFASREGREYGLADTFMNLAVGGTLGTGIHMTAHGMAAFRAKRAQVDQRLTLDGTETPENMGISRRGLPEVDTRSTTVPERIEAAGMPYHARVLQAVDAELAQGIAPRAAGEMLDMNPAARDPYTPRPEQLELDGTAVRNTAQSLVTRSQNPASAMPEGARVARDADTFIKEREAIDADDPDAILKEAGEAEQVFRQKVKDIEARAEEGAAVPPELVAAADELDRVELELKANEDFGKAEEALIRCLGGPE